jgi:hypothetical protein
MGKPSREFLQGLLTASAAVAEVTSDILMKDMQEQTWQIINKINLRLLELATTEARRLEEFNG